jgi:adenylate kinase
MNLALIGPSGVGKGTQIQKLVTAFGMHHFCPGTLFREAVKNRTPMGRVAKKHLDRGDLVPDDIVNGMVEEWVWATHRKASIVFDGYPRTQLQAVFLDHMFAEMGRKLNAVIYVQADDEVLIARLSKRRLCRVCPSQFHDTEHPFLSCPYKRCNGEYLYQQPEDRPAAVETRLAVFDRVIKPLLSHYQQTKKLIVVNGDGTAEQVHAEITRELQALPVEL